MDSLSFSIPINQLRQYCFCPRVVYYHMVVGLKVTYPVWVEYGQAYQEKQQALDKRRSLSKFRPLTPSAILRHNVKLEHPHYPFYGTCDALIIDEQEVIPIEFKTFTGKVSLGQKIQLAAYGLIAEQIFSKTLKRSYIVSGLKGKAKLVRMEDELKRKVIDICDNIAKINLSQSLPHSSANGLQCVQCEFLNHCNDRF